MSHQTTETTSAPAVHVVNLRRMLGEVAQHARQDARRVHEPKAKAMFETTAEILLGLAKVYEDYAGQPAPAI